MPWRRLASAVSGEAKKSCRSFCTSGSAFSWTTSEAADGQVFFRKAGTTAYQQTAIDATPELFLRARPDATLLAVGAADDAGAQRHAVDLDR